MGIVEPVLLSLVSDFQWVMMSTSDVGCGVRALCAPRGAKLNGAANPNVFSGHAAGYAAELLLLSVSGAPLPAPFLLAFPFLVCGKIEV